MYLCAYRLHLYGLPHAVKNAAFSITTFGDCASAATSSNVLHLNSVKRYLKETIPSDSLVVPFVTATILKHAVFEARKRERKKKKPHPPNILVHSEELDCRVEVCRELDGRLAGGGVKRRLCLWHKPKPQKGRGQIRQRYVTAASDLCTLFHFLAP